MQKGYRPLYNSFSATAWFFLRFFQIVISPQDGPNCRFHPTCSRYASEAVQRYGALVGSLLAGDRLIRCNPYNPPGNDPVPNELP
ncbi:MAG: membrane protein insertion efficiency factor YidD [Spirochaetes bacterium]|nr:membrane protein insertion efficiency factor YidD [Spirochaetota bacterium]